MQPAVFLDRDGVLTVERGYAISSIDEMEIIPGTAECVDRLKELGYLTIVITNQSAVAKGLYTEEYLGEMNRKLLDEVKVDDLYYCPHHPQGIIPQYSIKCECRKPETGMIRSAQKDHEIDMSGSFMVGDRACDILLGEKAGLKTVMVNSGYGMNKLEEECNPDYVFEDLRGFVDFLSK